MKRGDHTFEIEFHRRGSKGFTKLGPNGQSLRDLNIPTGSSVARRIGKLIDSKKGNTRKP